MKTNNYFIKQVRSKTFLIIGLVIFIISLVLGGFLYYALKDQEAVFLDKVTSDFEYAKVEVALLDQYFASEKTDTVERKYYLAYDKNNIPYVVVLDDENYKLLKDIQDYSLSEEETDAPTPIVIYGDSQIIPDEAYEYLYDFINTEEEIISLADLKTRVGKYYLNTYYDPSEDSTFVIIIFSVFAGVGLLFMSTYFIKIAKLRKTLEEDSERIEKISNDLETHQGIHNKKCKTFMTSDYIVSYNNAIKIIDIKNIIWVYPFEIRQNGLVTNKTIYVVTKDGKSNIFASVNALSNNNNASFQELYQELMNRTPNALHGYSKENQEKAREMYRK